MPLHLQRLLAGLAAAIAMSGSTSALADSSQKMALEHEYATQREEQRVTRLRDTSPGTVDFCSVVRVADEASALARDAREVTCHFNFGTTSLAELEAAGWEVTNMTSTVNRNRWGFHTTTLSITIRKARPAAQG